jgi:hypothetical protein
MEVLVKMVFDALKTTNLTEAERKEFITIIGEEIELRIGRDLHSILTDNQSREYKDIIYNGDAVIRRWLKENVPAYARSDIYRKLQALGFKGKKLNKEAAALFWFRQNHIDYEGIENVCKQEICAELKQYLSFISGDTG